MIGSRAVTDLQLDPSAVFGWVDPHRCRQRLGRWHSTHEALGVCDLSLFEHAAFDLEDGAPASVMHHLGSGIGDTRMTVLGVVPGEEVPAPGACVIIATVAIWVARRVTSNSLTASTCVMPPRTAFTALRRKSSRAAGGNERASVPFMPALFYMRTIYCTD